MYALGVWTFLRRILKKLCIWREAFRASGLFEKFLLIRKIIGVFTQSRNMLFLFCNCLYTSFEVGRPCFFFFLSIIFIFCRKYTLLHPHRTQNLLIIVRNNRTLPKCNFSVFFYMILHSYFA